MGRLFGTDGIRGIANKELTADIAYKIGIVSSYILAEGSSHAPRILIGLDTRISCDMLLCAMSAGICAVGGNAIRLGVIPTPAVAHLVRQYEADAGIVISASHNKFEFNGIKIFNSNGYKLPDEVEERIENIVLDDSEKIKLPLGSGLGKIDVEPEAKEDYKEYLTKAIDSDMKGLNISLDCANGSASYIAEDIFKQFGCNVKIDCNTPNGININEGCGSTHIEYITEMVLENGSDVGFAFDGDADRVLAVDEKGELVDGDVMLSILAIQMKKENSLSNDTVVATVMSNMGLFKMAEKNSLKIATTKVGDRYVLEEMLDKGYVLGGEQSGHIIQLQYNTTGDGILTALKILSIMKTTGKKLSELASEMEVYPQVLLNAKVKEKNKLKFSQDEVINKMAQQLEQDFHGEGRVLIRPSGTEPLIRVMIEGKDKKIIAERAAELVNLIEGRLGG